MEDSTQDISNVLSDLQDELYNMKVNFNEKMKEYSNKSDDVVKKPWTSATVEDAIREILDSNNPDKKKTNRQYGLTRKYDVMEIDEKKVLIKKRKSNEDPVIIILPVEEYFDTLLLYHRATEHGGRDKMLFALKHKFYVPRPAVETFVSLCKMCNTKKSQQQRNTVVRPITAKDSNLRGQVDLVDFHSITCGEYKWLMNYHDHATKFCLLRPLKTNLAAEVALELLKIFLDFGAPHILQSESGREFAVNVIKELSAMWPDCKIVHGRPQSQASVHSYNQDIENLLRAWMDDNGNTDWVIGCRFVQWQKNSSKNRAIGRSPYAALFGTEPKSGLGSMKIPRTILEKIDSEEDLERFREGGMGKEIPKKGEDNQVAYLEKEMCSVCSHNLNETSFVSCSSCSLKIHITCCQSTASISQEHNAIYHCDICNRQEKVIKDRKKTHEGQKRAAEKMTETSGKKLK